MPGCVLFKMERYLIYTVVFTASITPFIFAEGKHNNKLEENNATKQNKITFRCNTDKS